MEQPYEEIDSVQAANAEIVVSRRQGSSPILVIAPRKSYYDKSAGLERLYIPRFSSIEFSEIDQVEDFLVSLIDACRRVFDAEPHRLFISDDDEQPSGDATGPLHDHYERFQGERQPPDTNFVDEPSVSKNSQSLDHDWFKKNLTPSLYSVMHMAYGIFDSADFCRLTVDDLKALRGVFAIHINEFTALQRLICEPKPPGRR